jgi:BirA family transcriptional regulator, biotin operon repressor / biotin---[acetyl-CoA-carboxylase] ligase
MGFTLSPLAQQNGFRLEAFDAISSTNAAGLERGQAGEPGKLWIVSKNQASGRGRRGRAWSSPTGNLAASLVLTDGLELRNAATLGFVAGLCLIEALDAVAPPAVTATVDFRLKWPNDLLANGAKLAGILLESTQLPNGRLALVIGIGVNVVAFPEGLPYPAASLHGLGVDCDAETLFLAMSDSWQENFARWNGGQGLAAIRRRWLERAAGIGGEVAVRMDGGVVHGVFETIDDDCQFVIRESDGRRLKIAAGDVHFGAIASAHAD